LKATGSFNFLNFSNITPEAGLQTGFPTVYIEHSL